MRNAIWGLSALALTCATASAAQAASQDEPQGTTGTSFDKSDIVVTATRRPQVLQKIPAAITNLNRETFEKISPTHIGAAINLVPGVSFNGENTYRPSLTIRGVSGSNEDAAVAMYVDGVYIGRDLGQNLSNIDPESIQVLRGPQGALYGKNTLGGAVIVNSRKPTFDTHLSLLAGYGNDNWYNARMSLTGPIVPDKIAGYLFAYTTGNDGRYFNVFDRTKVGNRRDYGGQAALLFDVSDTTKITLRGDYSRNKIQEGNRKGVYAQGTFAPNEISIGYNNEVSLDYVGPGVIKNYGTSLNVTMEFEPFTVTSVSAYRGFHVHDSRDLDGTGLAQGTADILERQHQISQEITLASRGKKRFNWILGAQYFREDFDYLFWINDTLGTSIMPGFASRAPVFYNYTTKGYKTTSTGLYAQADFAITPQLTLAAGARYTIDKRSYGKTEVQTLSNPVAPGFLYVYGGAATYRALMPEASLTYEFASNISIYGKYGRSYRPGGFSVSPLFDTSAPSEYKKEDADSYEIGVRSRFFDNSLTLNLTAFRIDWSNQQVNFVNQIAARVIANVQSRSQGIEFEGSAQLSPALQVDVSATYLDATLGHVIFPTRDPVTRASFFTDAYGTPLNFAPKWSAAGAVTYTHAFNDEQKLMLRTDVAYKSKQGVQILRPDLAGPAIVRLNGRLEYTQGHYTVALWVKNALNRFSNYVSQSSRTLDVIGLTEPRTFGAEIGFKF